MRTPLPSFLRWPPPYRRLTLGERGERAAASYLKRHGYTIVAGGHRSRFGEIDLIAVWQKKLVVFVEVKTRCSRRAGDPALAVAVEQQQRVASSALAFLKSRDLLNYPARFDIVAVVWPKEARRPESIDHYRDAFQPASRGQFFS